MCEILVKAIDATHSDPIKDRRGCYKRGYPVVVMPDGHPWGNEERLPKFVVIKIPGVPVETAKKYIEEWTILVPGSPDVRTEILQRRKWQIRWADLPNAAKNKLANQGELIIATPGYSGPRDYTWAQVKQYFRNHVTGLDETEDL